MFAPKLGLHFTSEKAYGGLVTLQGIMNVDEHKMSLEFQSKDNLLRVIKFKERRLEMPYSQIQRVSLKQTWFSTRFLIQVNSLQLLEQFPGAKNGTITLTVEKKNRQLAKEIESYVNLRLSEIRLASLDTDQESEGE